MATNNQPSVPQSGFFHPASNHKLSSCKQVTMTGVNRNLPQRISENRGIRHSQSSSYRRRSRRVLVAADTGLPTNPINAR
jgi:hypothetical protein